MKAVFTVTSAIWTVLKPDQYHLNGLENFICAGSEKIYYLKDIPCFAVISSFK